MNDLFKFDEEQKSEYDVPKEWPKVNPHMILDENLENPIQKAIFNFTARIVEEQEDLIMATLRQIGGETYRDITIDKNKVVEALQLHKTMRWHSVKDEFPEVTGWYLCCFNDCRGVLTAKYDPTDMYWKSVWNKNITHWMPLPKEPEVE